MISILLVTVCVIALIRMHPVALAFALACSSHHALSDGLSPTMYYLSAGAVDVVVIGFIAVFISPSRIAIAFIFICLASLLLNVYGWVIWFFYLPPITYNMGFIVLYCLAILFLLRKDSTKNERRNNLHWRFGVFPAVGNKGAPVCSALQEEGRN